MRATPTYADHLAPRSHHATRVSRSGAAGAGCRRMRARIRSVSATTEGLDGGRRGRDGGARLGVERLDEQRQVNGGRSIDDGSRSSEARGPRSPLRRTETVLDRLLRFVVGAIMLLAVLINFANVVARYVFLRPFIWAEEAMQFLNVWAVLLGTAVVTRTDSHLKMDALLTVLSPALRRALDALGAVLGVTVALYVVAQSVGMIRMLATTGQRSVIAGVPMDLMYLAIPLGFGTGALFAVLGIYRRRSRRAGEAAAKPEVV